MPPYGTDYEFSETYTRCGFADITDPVLSDSARERANASVDETRTRTMFTQFTPKARTSTSQDRRGELKETHKENRIRLGFSEVDNGATIRTHSKWVDGRWKQEDKPSKQLQKEVMEGICDSRDRLGWVSQRGTRDPASREQQQHVSGLVYEGRSRLGMLEEQSYTSPEEFAAVRAKLADTRARAGANEDLKRTSTFKGEMKEDRELTSARRRAELKYDKEVERSRLGMLVERDPASLSQRNSSIEGKKEERARLGMFEERTRPTKELVDEVVQGKWNERARLGFLQERSYLDENQRKETKEILFDMRARKGFVDDTLKSARARLSADEGKEVRERLLENRGRLGMLTDRGHSPRHRAATSASSAVERLKVAGGDVAQSRVSGGGRTARQRPVGDELLFRNASAKAAIDGGGVNSSGSNSTILRVNSTGKVSRPPAGRPSVRV